MTKEKNTNIVFDARMINMSGIGRYIQALIPVFISNFSQVTLLGNMADIQKYNWAGSVSIIQADAPIYSISEQIEIYRKTPACDIFLSPHYNSPLYLPQAKKIAVIIPDTNHLVFKKDFSLLKSWYATLFYQVSIKRDIIFTISDFSKSEIIKYTRCDPNKIISAKLSIDKEYFKDLDIQLSTTNVSKFENFSAQDYILYIGNIKPHKNLKRALLAFEIAEKSISGLRFLIVGKKDNFLTGDNEVFKLVESSSDLKNKVDFTGHVSDLTLAYLYKHAKVFLFPSLYEGFGIPPLEAMIFGCPTIVSREGSLPEVCGNASYYCDAYNVDNIANAITTVVLEKDIRDDLINKGLAKVDEYDWSVFTTAVLNGLIQL